MRNCSLGRRILALTASIFLLACCPLSVFSADEVGTRSRELEVVIKQMQALQKEIAARQAQRSSEQQALKAAEQRAAKIAGQYHEAIDSLARAERQLKTMQAQQQTANNDVSKQLQAMLAELRLTWRLDHNSSLKLILNQRDPAMISRALMYARYFSRARAQRLARLEQTLQQLGQGHRDLLNSQAQLKRRQDQLQDEQKSLKEVREVRRAALDKLTLRLNNDQRRLKTLQLDRDELEQLLAKLRRLARDKQRGTPFAKLRGKLKWPTAGKVRHRYGTARGVGNLKWRGILIAAPTGNEVFAVHSGRVVFADWLNGYGYMVILEHGEQYMTLYGHNQRLDIKLGANVNEGDRIATVGNSGGQTHTGLYFEVRQRGKPANPQTWLQRELVVAGTP